MRREKMRRTSCTVHVHHSFAIREKTSLLSSSSSSVLFGAGKSESGWDSSFSWGVKERNNIAIGIDGQEDGNGSTGSVKIQLYGEGAFALGKKNHRRQSIPRNVFSIQSLERLRGRESGIRQPSRGSPYKSNSTFGATEECFPTTMRVSSSPQTRGLRPRRATMDGKAAATRKRLRVSKTILHEATESLSRISSKQKTTLRKR